MIRTLVITFLLSAAALAQTDQTLLASSAPAAPEFSSSRTFVAPVIKVTPPAQSPQKAESREQNKRSWYLLAMASHSASAFDAWTTNRAIANGGQELNPLLKPFAGTNSLYPVMQIGPAVTDYVGFRMKRSNNKTVRRFWWMPQVASTALSLTCGFKNLSH